MSDDIEHAVKDTRLNIGGLMRCCTGSLAAWCDEQGADTRVADDTIVSCQHCDAEHDPRRRHVAVEPMSMIDLTREEILDGLRAGRVLCIDRRDSPTLPTVMALQSEGLVTTELVQVDEQSSVLKVRLASGAA